MMDFFSNHIQADAATRHHSPLGTVPEEPTHLDAEDDNTDCCEDDNDVEEDEDEQGDDDVEEVPSYAEYGDLPHDVHMDVQREKQGYLLELRKYEHQGMHLTKSFSMRDSLEDLQFEYDRIKMNLDTLSGVNFMKDAMKLAFTGIELANSKMGPFMHLDGWSREMTQDMQKYNHCLEKLYKKHWRKGSMAPETELAFMILGSMVVHHFKSKFCSNISVTDTPAFASSTPGLETRRRAPQKRRATMRPPTRGGGGAPSRTDGLSGLGGLASALGGGGGGGGIDLSTIGSIAGALGGAGGGGGGLGALLGALATS